MGGTNGKSKKHPIRVVINGLYNAGKTTLLYQLKLGEVIETMPSMDFSVETVDYKNIKFVTWDVGGRNKTRPLYRHFYKDTDAIIFVVDSSERYQIDETRKELHRIPKEESLKEAIVVIMANKQDIHGAMTPKKVDDTLDLNSIRRSHMCEVFGTSAITGEGLYEMLDWVVEAVSTKQIAGISKGKKCETSVEKENRSKSFYSISPVSFIKHMFSKV